MSKRNKIRTLIAMTGMLCMARPAAAEIPELLQPVGVQLATAKAEMGEMFKITAYDGAVVPHVEELSFPIDGEIAQINVIAGQPVRKGDVLMTLDREAQDKRLELLGTQMENLRSEDGYARELARIDRSILEAELDALLSQIPRDEDAVALKRLDIEAFDLNTRLSEDLRAMRLERLQAEYMEIDAASGDAELVAPCDGRVMLIKPLNTGDRVIAYAPVIYLADDSRLSIQTKYVSAANIDLAADVYALIGGARREIEYVPMDVQEYMSRVFSGEDLVSHFAPKDADGLTAGTYAVVCAVMNYIPEALIIPRNALYIDGTEKYVYIVEDGVRIRREVETGVLNDWQAQILSGLEEGEVVYVQD